MPVCMGSQDRKFLVRMSTAVIKTTNNQKKLGEEISFIAAYNSHHRGQGVSAGT